MLTTDIDKLIKQAIYEKDENGVFIAQIPSKQGYYTQWDSLQEAQDNLLDLVKCMIIDEIKSGNSETMPIIKNFSWKVELQYA